MAAFSKIVYEENWSILQKALYFDHIGEWHKAHDMVDSQTSQKAAHIHAYLHRKEGDLWNSKYWYNKAGRSIYKGSLEEEWSELWNQFE